ncbi:hypothetical protein MAN_02963, partial [Metarhizium hybridum]
MSNNSCVPRRWAKLTRSASAPTFPHHFSIHALIATHQTRDTNTPQRQWRPEQHPTTAQHNGSLAALVVQPHGFVCPSASNQAPAPPISIVIRPSDTNAAQDNHNRLVADILTRYRTLMMLATVQAEGERSNATPETMAVSGISMKMEFDGLNSSIKDLLSLSRKIKELWVFGPLGQGDPDRKAKDAQIEDDVALVSGLLNGLDGRRMRDLAQRCGGTWEVLAKEDATTAK